MAVLYRHIRLDTNVPFYIGIGKIEKRAFDKIYRNNLWKGIVRRTDFRVDILFEDLTWEEACEKEKEFIKLYGRIDLGLGTLCNLTDGGDGSPGARRTQETKMKISQAQKGDKGNNYGKKHTEEVKRKISEAQKGEKNHNFAKNFSNETREKLRQANLGKKTTKEIKDKISKTLQKDPKPRYRKCRNTFRVTFRRFGDIIYLGSFKTEQEAWYAIEEWKKNNEKVLSP